MKSARLVLLAIPLFLAPAATGCRVVGASIDLGVAVVDTAIDTTFEVVDGTIDLTCDALDEAADAIDSIGEDDHDDVIVVHDCHPDRHPPALEPCEPGRWAERDAAPDPALEPEDGDLPAPRRGEGAPDLGAVRPGNDPLAFLGVEFSTERPARGGVRINRVVAGSSADRAGLKKGDVIYEVSGIEVRSPEDLMLAIRVREVGEQVEVALRRDGAEWRIRVRLGFRSRPM